MQPKDDKHRRGFRIVFGDDVSLSVVEEKDFRYEVGLIIYDYVNHEYKVADVCRIWSLPDLFNIVSHIKANNYSDFPEYEEKYRGRMQALTDQVYAMGGGAD